MSTIRNVQAPGCVELVGTKGTGFFPVYGDFTAANSIGLSNLNPCAAENSTAATDDKIFVLDVPPGYNWLDTYLVVQGASATITTPLKGVFYGKQPFFNPAENFNGNLAADPKVSSTYAAVFGTAAATADGNQVESELLSRGGIWHPLDNPVTGVTEHTFPTTFSLTQNLTAATATYPNIGGLRTTSASSIAAHRMTARTTVYLGGCRRVLFLPTQLAVLGGSGANAMMIGRFVV